MRFIKTILLFLVPVLMTAQHSMEEEVKSLFDESNEVIWVHSYSGYVNNITKVEATVASDGKNYKGIVYFPSSGFSTEITGPATGDRLIVNEVNEDGLITGKINGTITASKIKGKWSNYNNSIGSNYELTNDKELSKSKKSLEDDKWVRWYIGQISNEVLHLILHKKTTTEVFGSCYNETGSRAYSVTGKINEDKSIDLQFLLGEHEMASFKGKMPKGKLIKGKVSGIGLVDEDLSFYLDNKLNFEETSFQSFNTTYEILLPKTGTKDFDQFVKKNTEDWVKECIAKSTAKSYKESEIPAPEERLINRAYIYPDIRYVADNLISGHLIYVNTWTGKTKTKPINFDLKNDVELTMEQLFLKDFPYKDSINSYLASIGKSIYSFPFFNITPEGLRLYNEFEPINGRTEVLLPYSVIKPWARKSGPLKKIL